MPGASAGAGQSQPAKKVPGAGAGLWCRLPVPVPVSAGQGQPAKKVPSAGAGLWGRVPVRVPVPVSVNRHHKCRVPGAFAGQTLKLGAGCRSAPGIKGAAGTRYRHFGV